MKIKKEYSWSPEKRKLIGVIILSKFMALSLKRFETFVLKIEESSVFRKYVHHVKSGQGFKVITPTRIAGVMKQKNLSRHTLAHIAPNGDRFYILFRHTCFATVYHYDRDRALSLKNSGKITSSGYRHLESLAMKLRRVSTRNEITAAILRELVKVQNAFLKTEDMYGMKPFTRGELAARLKKRFPVVDTSVISRLVTGKSIMTPSGYEIRLATFFMSKRDIYKRHIRRVLIDEYEQTILRDRDGFHLTDAGIRRILKNQYNMSVGIRNICGIRKELGIPSGRNRTAKYPCSMISGIDFSRPHPLTRESINKNGIDGSGVYELLAVSPHHQPAVVYIGSSKNIRKRLNTYLNPRCKNRGMRKMLNRHPCYFRYAHIHHEWRRYEKQLFELYVKTFGVLPACNCVSP